MTLQCRSAGGLPVDRLDTQCSGEALGRGPRTVLLGRIDDVINSHVDNLYTRERVLLTTGGGSSWVFRKSAGHRLRWRTASKSTIAAATPALSEVDLAGHRNTYPFVGGREGLVGQSVLLGPDSDRDPPVRSVAVWRADASGVVATSRMPRAANHGPSSAHVVVATGTAYTAPLLPRMTLGLPQSVTGSTAMTACTPADSAERSIEPRLPGFSMPSATSTKASAGTSSASRGPECRQDGQEAVRSLPVGDLLEGGPREGDRLDPRARRSLTRRSDAAGRA